MNDSASRHPASVPQPVDIESLLAEARPPTFTRSRRLLRRQLITLMCLLIVPVSLSVTLGFAWYVRSDGYRASLERSLSARLGMTVSIASIQPDGLSGRILDGVRVQLSGDGSEVFACNRAVWKRVDSGAKKRHVLVLEDGWLLAGASQWTRNEYDQMLTGGLGHEFEQVGLSEVRLVDMDVRFAGRSLSFSADRASGALLFEPDGTGVASVDCRRLNSVSVDRPVTITARFLPGERSIPRFENVRLTVPTIPLEALGIAPTHVGEDAATFEGTISYAPDDGTDVVSVSGSLRDADLERYTTLMPGGPISGTVSVDVREAVFEEQRLSRLDLSGRVFGVDVRSLAPALVADGRNALLSLTIDQLLWENNRIERLAASGNCGDLSLEAVTSLIGKGTVTGTAGVEMRSVLVVADRLMRGDATIEAIPPARGPALISREVIARAAQRWLGVNPSAILPEQVEYLELGARLTVDDDRLRVHGTHGPDGKTILTVSLFGRPVGLVRELDRTFALPDIVSMIRDHVRGLEAKKVRDLWEELHEDSE